MRLLYDGACSSAASSTAGTAVQIQQCLTTDRDGKNLLFFSRKEGLNSRGWVYSRYFTGNFAHSKYNINIIELVLMKKRCFLVCGCVTCNDCSFQNSVQHNLYYVEWTIYLHSNNVLFLMSSPNQRPPGFSLHLGWCHVTERPWSHNATTSTPSSRLSTSSLYLCSEPWTKPPQPPHDSFSGALDKVSKVFLVSIVCSVWVLQYV